MQRQLSICQQLSVADKVLTLVLPQIGQTSEAVEHVSNAALPRPGIRRVPRGQSADVPVGVLQHVGLGSHKAVNRDQHVMSVGARFA